MSIKHLVMAGAFAALLGLAACNPHSTASDNPSQPQTNSGHTGAIAFRLPADFVKSQLGPDYKLYVNVYGSKLERSIFLDLPADTNDIWVPNLRAGTAYVSLSLVNDKTQLNYYANDTVRIEPYKLSRLSLTLRPRNDIFPEGALQVTVNVDTTHRQDSSVYWKCTNYSQDGKYCYDSGLRDTAVVGPWNCSAWRMVNGMRSCQAWLPEVATPNTDGYCAKRIEGSPMLCTQIRDKYDPYYVPYKVDSSSAWIPQKQK
ncbi:MAG: hypothetical protein IPK50_07410 [Fibrobacterota bacterium]|nr:hypothetical protein [Fibrobacterota bacterium]QQS06720.1 MAG: hypothetical protein IPK50_07410 [Fibrobacterota bacterium]